MASFNIMLTVFHILTPTLGFVINNTFIENVEFTGRKDNNNSIISLIFSPNLDNQFLKNTSNIENIDGIITITGEDNKNNGAPIDHDLPVGVSEKNEPEGKKFVLEEYIPIEAIVELGREFDSLKAEINHDESFDIIKTTFGQSNTVNKKGQIVIEDTDFTEGKIIEDLDALEKHKVEEEIDQFIMYEYENKKMLVDKTILHMSIFIVIVFLIIVFFVYFFFWKRNQKKINKRNDNIDNNNISKTLSLSIEKDNKYDIKNKNNLS